MDSQIQDDVALTELAPPRILEHEIASAAHQEDWHSVREDGRNRQEFSLPRADGGRDAWLLLAGCFSIEALVWGRYQSITFTMILSSNHKKNFMLHNYYYNLYIEI